MSPTYLPREISFLTFSSNDKPGTAAFGCQMIRIHGNPGANHGKLQSTLLLQELEITNTNGKGCLKNKKMWLFIKHGGW